VDAADTQSTGFTPLKQEDLIMKDDKAPSHATPATQRAEYPIWKAMLQKCGNPKSSAYARFGGRGIRICPQWQGRSGFEQFLADVGPQVSPGAGLKQIDPDGDFAPGNVKWCEDTRPCRELTHAGRTMSIEAWAHELGVKPTTLWARLHDGWSAEKVLNPKVQRRRSWGTAKPVRNEPLPELVPIEATAHSQETLESPEERRDRLIERAKELIGNRAAVNARVN
jgi:hypothetical protein